jgi:hypothetical protein
MCLVLLCLYLLVKQKKKMINPISSIKRNITEYSTWYILLRGSLRNFNHAAHFPLNYYISMYVEFKAMIFYPHGWILIVQLLLAIQDSYPCPGKLVEEDISCSFFSPFMFRWWFSFAHGGFASRLNFHPCHNLHEWWHLPNDFGMAVCV